MTEPAADPPTSAQEDAAAAIEAALRELGLGWESPQPGSYLVKLEGQHKLATMTWLIAGRHSLHVEAFFCRQPDEDHARFYRFLLERSGRMFGVHFALDPAGDVYLVGRLPLASVSTAEVDRILGCVLTYSDENFDPALAIGFASSIRKEWAWRVKRGESLANLRAFARLADPEHDWAAGTNRLDQAGDGLRGLADRFASLVAARPDRLGHAVAQVLLQQPQRDRLQGPGHRRDLGEHIDAVDVLFHHALQAAHLALDPPQAFEVGVLVLRITAHAARIRGRADIPQGAMNVLRILSGGLQRTLRFARCTGAELGPSD